MTDTIDRLVRILDEEREARRKAEQDRVSVNYSLMDEQAKLKLAKQDRQQAYSDLDMAEAKIKEWIKYARELEELIPVKKRPFIGVKPASYYRSDIPF